MSSSTAVPTAVTSTIYLGLDVHKESITIAVLPASAPAPTRVEKLSSDLAKLLRVLDRFATGGELGACGPNPERGRGAGARPRALPGDLGGLGRWAFVEITDPWRAKSLLRGGAEEGGSGVSWRLL